MAHLTLSEDKLRYFVPLLKTLFKQHSPGFKPSKCSWYVEVLVWFIMKIIEIIIIVAIVIPFSAIACVELLAFGLLIPLGFVMAAIKRHLFKLWLGLTLFVHVGNLMDLGSDIALVAEVVYFNIFKKEESGSDVELPELEFANQMRIIIILLSSMAILFYLKLVDKKFKMGGIAGPLGMLFYCLLNKIFLVRNRIRLLKLWRKMCREKHLNEEDEEMSMQSEFLAMLDIIWSGLPMGVVVAYELFFIKGISELDANDGLEVAKLIALGIDLIGTVYFWYFIMLNLENKCFGEEKHVMHEKQALVSHTDRH